MLQLKYGFVLADENLQEGLKEISTGKCHLTLAPGVVTDTVEER